MKRLTIAVWVAVTLALVLAACGRFPTSGPIETVGDGGSGERPTGIDVAAQPPSDGASPEAILEGFFAASESPADGYAVARQYLTDQAASSWRPEDGINIYDSSGQSRVITADGSAVVRASLVGRLGSDHVFTAVRDTEYNHNFELTTVDGQWRINNPGEGILMSRQRFQQAFQPVSVYFLSSAAAGWCPSRSSCGRPSSARPLRTRWSVRLSGDPVSGCVPRCSMHCRTMWHPAVPGWAMTASRGWP